MSKIAFRTAASQPAPRTLVKRSNTIGTTTIAIPRDWGLASESNLSCMPVYNRDRIRVSSGRNET